MKYTIGLLILLSLAFLITNLFVSASSSEDFGLSFDEKTTLFTSLSNIEKKVEEYIKPVSFMGTRYKNLEFSYIKGSKSIVLPQMNMDPLILPYSPTVGSSMLPIITPGNTILRMKYTGQDLHEGDIICYRYEGLVCHRIIAVTSEGVYTQGDNNLEPDKDGFVIPLKEIESIVVGVIFTDESKSPTVL